MPKNVSTVVVTDEHRKGQEGGHGRDHVNIYLPEAYCKVHERDHKKYYVSPLITISNKGQCPVIVKAQHGSQINGDGDKYYLDSGRTIQVQAYKQNWWTLLD